MRFLLKSFVVFGILMYSQGFAQEIPNHSFEDWANGIPEGWFGVAILKSATAFDGNSSVSMQVLSDGGEGVIIPFLWIGETSPGTNVSERYGSFKGYYRFNPNGNESLNVQVLMNLNGVPIGVGQAQLSATSPSTWTEFSVPISYSTDETPNIAQLFLNVSNLDGGGVIGSNALVDFVSFDNITSIETVNGVSEQVVNFKNSPNPFDLSTTISFEMNNSTKATLEVFNLSGRKVATLIENELVDAGHNEIGFDAMGLPSGLYFLTLTADGFTITRKMNLVR